MFELSFPLCLDLYFPYQCCLHSFVLVIIVAHSVSLAFQNPIGFLSCLVESPVQMTFICEMQLWIKCESISEHLAFILHVLIYQLLSGGTQAALLLKEVHKIAHSHGGNNRNEDSCRERMDESSNDR